MIKSRGKIADLILNNLKKNQVDLKKQFDTHKNAIGFFYLDNLLPNELALEIYRKFPSIEETIQRKSLREKKFTAFQMNKYNSLLEEVIYAFQDKRIVTLIGSICSVEAIYPDEFLYAGGLSLMPKGNFLNPHLDNSHDKERNRWRVLNLLYYVTPDWETNYGGNLEVWPKGLEEEQITITSKFNRFVVMATHQKSWHSVSKVKTDATRSCISNYYFSDVPLKKSDTFHITTFRGRPQEKLKDFLLKVDNKTRSLVRKVFKKGIRENPHQYKK